MQDQQNKNILITGAGSGLGKAIVDELASDDIIISVIGRNKNKLSLLPRSNVHVIQGDVTNEILINKVPLHLTNEPQLQPLPHVEARLQTRPGLKTLMGPLYIVNLGSNEF